MASKPAFDHLARSRSLRHHLELFEVGSGNSRGAVSVEMPRKIRPHATARTASISSGKFERAVQPPSSVDFKRRAGSMKSCAIENARRRSVNLRVHNRELVLRKQRLQRREARVQTKKSAKV